MELLKTLPKWLLVALFLYVAGLFSYGVYDNRAVELFPPKISAKQASGTQFASSQDFVAKSDVEANYVRKSIVERDYAAKDSSHNGLKFAAGEWHYFATPPHTSGRAVEGRLNQIQPSPDNLFVAYDGSANDTFHVWYRGGRTGTTYTYVVAGADKLTDPATQNVFLADGTRVPAGIGTANGVAVPIYFEVTR